MDPTERHGFEYQRWFGFTLFAKGYTAALGRGGTYAISKPDGGEEVAIGFSLFPDPIIDRLTDTPANNRLFLPLGHEAVAAKQLRTDGWVTVKALSPDDDALALGCSHYLGTDGPIAV